MKFLELKQKLIDNTFDIADLDVKTYLPLIEKKVIVRQVCEDIVEYEDGMAFDDYTQKIISKTLAVLLNYCQLEVDENTTNGDIIDVIDLLFEKGIYNKIEEKIGDDLREFCWTIDEMIDNIKFKNNNIEGILARGINKIADIINTNLNSKQIKSIIKLASKEFKNFQPEKLQTLNDMLNMVEGKNNVKSNIKAGGNIGKNGK